jgi:hypothetical protein
MIVLTMCVPLLHLGGAARRRSFARRANRKAAATVSVSAALGATVPGGSVRSTFAPKSL